MADVVGEKVALLETVFRDIAAHRMQGVPLLHGGLRVQAVGFARVEDAPWAIGVLVTPWFMNLLRLPLGMAPVLGLGEVGSVRIGAHRLGFIGAFEPALGAYEMCSLTSPMFEFTDQAAAVATAREVLAVLRQPVPAAEPDVVAGRRRFLFGRGPAEGADRAARGAKGVQ